MKILSENNKTLDTDEISSIIFYQVLSFRDYKNPDFYMEKLPYIDQVQSASIALSIGPHKLVMPYAWSVLLSDMSTLECVPIYEVIGKTMPVFCSADGVRTGPRFLPIRTGMIYPNTTWTAPPLGDKDMLVVPLGPTSDKPRLNREGKEIDVGPICAIFGPSKMDISKSISEIW